MAIFSVCLCCSKLPPNPNLQSLPASSFSLPATPQVSLKSAETQRNGLISLSESISRASFLALVSASLFFASDPALAFKGGGPYGAGVTRGQDLTGKDFRADLSDADLRGADFSLANVTKANLSNANLEGALATGNTSFKGSVIQGADFTDVPLREDQREYLCKIADGVNPVTGNAMRDIALRIAL
ncbi:hypothetical protein HAX54_025199 [Datura stramonium]|uniref:Uncharacterized protein n=1 Tax=Datura stramonium TaxID=4076 RepID=A0ABS8S632_DATST|nr:hypothetical protein [Datura stramonium]